jgi:RNA polymerase sigma factor (sigma-70 family)
VSILAVMRVGRRESRANLLGDVEAIYRRRLPELRRVAAAVSGDRLAAPDIVQDAFVRAVRDLESFRGGGSLEGWLWRIVVNLARNHARDERPVAELPGELADDRNGRVDPGEGRVATAVLSLPERQRLVLFLRYYADLDYGAIAQALEISPGTVGATLHAARSVLQKRLVSKEAAR